MPISAAFERAQIHGKWGEKAKPFSHKLAFVTQLYRHIFVKKRRPCDNFKTFWWCEGAVSLKSLLNSLISVASSCPHLPHVAFIMLIALNFVHRSKLGDPLWRSVYCFSLCFSIFLVIASPVKYHSIPSEQFYGKGKFREFFWGCLLNGERKRQEEKI